MHITLNTCIIAALLAVSGPVLGQVDQDHERHGYWRDDVVVGCYVEMCGPNAKQEDRLREIARELVDELIESQADDDNQGDEP